MTETPDNTAQRRNARMALGFAGLAGGMVGLAFAAVPLYDAFCRITGYGGTTQVAGAASGTVLDRTITVEFDANVGRGLPWEFKPLQRSQTIQVGENGLAFYQVTNTSDRPIVGQATYNVTPVKMGPYFAKIDCFCFTEQLVQPGQTINMPVSYFVDPALAEDEHADEITTVTLSYTFFPSPETVQQTAALDR